MSEHSDLPELSRSKRPRIAKILLAGLGLWILAAFVWPWIYSATHDATPTIYHHADGTFSLNQKNGPATTPSEVLKHLMHYEGFGTIRLVGHSDTLLQDWVPMLEECCLAGAPRYQFEINGLVYRFHLPLCMIESEDSLAPEIIYLAEAEYPGPKDTLPLTEVAIVSDEFTTCGEVIAAAAPHTERGRSVTVVGENWYLRHSKGEDFRGREAFRRRRSEFWMRNIQPVIDWVNSAF